MTVERTSRRVPDQTGLYTKAGKECCKRWNDTRGCPKPCPQRKTHGCDVLVADNVACGGNHTRDKCPHRAASQNYSNDAKGKKR